MLNFKSWLAEVDAKNPDLGSVLKGATVTLIGNNPATASATQIVNQLVKDKNVQKASQESPDPVTIDPKKLKTFVQNQINTATGQQQKAAAMAGKT